MNTQSCVLLQEQRDLLNCLKLVIQYTDGQGTPIRLAYAIGHKVISPSDRVVRFHLGKLTEAGLVREESGFVVLTNKVDRTDLSGAGTMSGNLLRSLVEQNKVAPRAKGAQQPSPVPQPVNASTRYNASIVGNGQKKSEPEKPSAPQKKKPACKETPLTAVELCIFADLIHIAGLLSDRFPAKVIPMQVVKAVAHNYNISFRPSWTGRGYLSEHKAITMGTVTYSCFRLSEKLTRALPPSHNGRPFITAKKITEILRCAGLSYERRP